jgi:hypothetical protein
MSGLTASTLPVVCGAGPVTCTRSARKRTLQRRYRHAATASWWTERNLIPPTIEAAATPGTRCESECRREGPRLHREGCSLQTTPPLDSSSRRRCAATHSNGPIRFRLHRPAPPPLRHNQQQVPSQSVQAPNVNSSSLNYMFKVVTTVLLQIMSHDRARWGRVRRRQNSGHHKNRIRTN